MEVAKGDGDALKLPLRLRRDDDLLTVLGLMKHLRRVGLLISEELPSWDPEALVVLGEEEVEDELPLSMLGI